jgi:hypothetical protein
MNPDSHAVNSHLVMGHFLAMFLFDNMHLQASGHNFSMVNLDKKLLDLRAIKPRLEQA